MQVKGNTGLNSSKNINYEAEMGFLSEPGDLNSMVPDEIEFGDDLDDTEGGKISINQAFDDDDVITEFM